MLSIFVALLPGSGAVHPRIATPNPKAKKRQQQRKLPLPKLQSLPRTNWQKRKLQTRRKRPRRKRRKIETRKD
jgi:hypothetical protein